MKALPWIIAGVGIGIGVTILLFNTPEPALETGYDRDWDTGYNSVDRAARKTFGWGTKNKVAGKAGSVAGSIKEGIGALTGNDDLANEGAVDRFAGKARDAAGELGQAAAQTLHDLNK